MEKARDIRPGFYGIQLALAATYIDLGLENEARIATAEVRRIVPKFTLEDFQKTAIYKDQDCTKRFINTLRKAGVK